MTDFRYELREILDGLLAIPVPSEVNIESWSQFLTDRQELLDELSLLVDSAPTLIQGLLVSEFAPDLDEAMERVEFGFTQLKLEMSSVREEMETARKSAVLVQHTKKSRAEPGALLGVA
jgi:hypothetical protein